MKELSSDNINGNDFSLGGLYTARERKRRVITSGH